MCSSDLTGAAPLLAPATSANPRIRPSSGRDGRRMRTWHTLPAPPPSAAAPLAFLYGLCEVEELPGSYLVEVFGALNMSASGARSYLARAVADGRLVSHRRGRQTAYALNGTFLRRYRTIEQRFISRPDWEGRFHIVIYDIPETRRSERDALRAAAFVIEIGRASCRERV